MNHVLTITPAGDVRIIYDDDLRGLIGHLGVARIRRVSFVEPDESGLWWADLEPLRGPRIGPFHFRHQALAAEREWLEAIL